jgi:S1-C subfamily serine protease
MRTRLVPAVAVLALLWGTAPLWAQEAPDRPPRAFLGIQAEPSPAGAKQAGVLIRNVAPGSPAAKAGLKQGDEIVKVDNKDVKDFDALVNLLAQHKAGEKLSFEVVRNGKEENVTVTLGERPRPGAGIAPRENATPFLGVATQELTPAEKTRLGVKANAGVVVGEVVPGTPAAEAGLKKGDVITSFNGKAITNPAELRDAVRQAGVGKEVTLEAARGAETKTFKTRLEAAPADFFVPPAPRREGNLREATPREQAAVQQRDGRVDELG